ncbi:PREDICTED: AAA-ATPase At3g28570, mitochondrial [Camelina sativa]|uniref:AAA-ATPase At3g28570, mitochondrial n=1 Tax=Camelina sativa TaxID=90675 RepID=A0ABM0TFG3_CAMSA|nr:PREDICTED: AAA-ATPase At3g28570, mitochondrial [Camelina sativa]
MSKTKKREDQTLQTQKTRKPIIEILMGSIVKPMFGNNLTTIGSNIAGLFFVWSTLKRYFPRQIQQLLLNAIQRVPILKKLSDKILGFLSPYAHISFREIEECRFNFAYAAVKTYLGAKVNSGVKNLKGNQLKENTSLDLKRDDVKIEEEYEGVTMCWEILKCAKGKKICKLTFHRSNWDVVTGSYLSYVMEEGRSIQARKKKVKVYMNNPSLHWKLHTKGLWTSVEFEHPATFDTLAMDIEKRDEILSDLLAFRDGKEYYDRIGKAWKRGYLLFGPPGTGKSTMIAAMANLMKYNIYDLELTSIENNWELKKLLISTTSKSIIVIEDIDCSLDLTGERNGKDVKGDKEVKKKKALTLSGLLNFIDGIWSACGQERIIVFTTNHLDKLDRALIRRGRMDMHIELSYCTFGAFKILAKNYLNLDSHPLFGKIESLLKETKITPADVAENLMVQDLQTEVDGSLNGLIRALGIIKWSQNFKADGQHSKEITQI